MHILAGLAAIIGGLAIWYYRMKMIGDVANEVGGAFGRVQGQFRRARLRKKAALSPVASIDEPLVGAAVLMVVVAEAERRMTREAEAEIQDALSDLADRATAAEAFRYAEWATRQVSDPDTVARLLAPLFCSRLDLAERRDFLSLLGRVAAADGSMTDEQADIIAMVARRLKVEPASSVASSAH